MTRLITKRSVKLGAGKDPRRMFVNVPAYDRRLTNGLVRLNGEKARSLAQAYRLAAGRYPVCCQVVTASGEVVHYQVCNNDADIGRYAARFALGEIIIRPNPTWSPS